MESCWKDFLAEARTRYPDDVETWFVPMQPEPLAGDSVKIRVPNEYFLDWVRDNYSEFIRDTLSSLLNRSVDITFAVGRKDARKEKRSDALHPQLNEKFTFEEFVGGSSNQFARAAALAVVDKLGGLYNPLLIYSNSGLGKTHLITAIGHEVYRRDHSKNILYVRAEAFMNDFVTAMRYNRMHELREKYRSVDLLLIDDIQFFKNKDKTQEEFFNTFNTLYESKKQIVMTSDQFPSHMTNLEDRLKTRFAWGLTIDIQPPEFEMRVAILQRKAAYHHTELAMEIAEFIAENISEDVRRMEGALLKLLAYASLNRKPLTVSLARDLLKDYMPSRDMVTVSVEVIQKATAEYFHVKVSDLKSQSKLKNIAVPRQIAIYLARKLTDLSLVDIGNKFGGKDHSTVIYSNNKIARLVKEDEKTRKHVENLECLLKKY